MRTSLGQRRQGKQSARKSNGEVTSDEDMDFVQGPTYDNEEDDAQDDGDDDIDEDEDEEDEFFQQRMPEQHPAIRTTIQLMGTL